ncbi:MAG: hypothetical protein UT86_C0002G0076 [Candidatus Magasanikbacteria bacterium GW2011_GWC2_40_17]|uniref:TraC-like domain-containing protein n=1 Tax=Candidatus Magasanikbacteria bacterium GW2011_GWA2_42_32 TaxID=1619039 RepID=A0A0G1A859_9BACT|nr:MAG: hypothetical protein UT86_C0002G0076 [Candidatus Magasanikbacteria bacterium GW2011_GWC2_40_17]KKS57237.1 MAG: hypothetical protein UV20_C0002G0026 [Candidatus Magasanikbacteria bacterium GW2011_GWA2_42_32]OGH86129.1 MAG: hypothetical protein A2294_02635 [Candidatus Magasanikbacteria bacterium RIFOXYB2_FULL_38_10]
MQSSKLAGSKINVSTQQYLDIASIHDDILIMKDGTLRAVLLASSINFALKSEEEQNALISAYASFLNTLEYPLQIVLQSRKLNMDAYLEKLKKSQEEQTNELLKMQIADYRGFIDELVDLGQIMSKKFFVIVPFNPSSNKRKSFFARFKETFTPAIFVGLKRELFLNRKKDLMSRVSQIQGQLQSFGINTIALDTEGLIELYYSSYNPQLSDVEKMVDTDRLQIEK